MPREIMYGEVSFIPYPKNGYFFSDFEYSIFKIKLENGTTITCKGETFPIYKGQRLKLEGEKKREKTGEFVLDFESVEKHFESNTDFKEFIASFAGIQTAKRMVEHFGSGEKTLSVLKENPERLKEVRGIAQKKMDTIVENYQKNIRIESVFKAFKKYGLTMKECSKIISNFGDDAVEKIKSNPYRLAFKFLSFNRCDEIAENMGHPMDSHERNVAAMIETLKEEQISGNTYTTERDFFKNVRKLLASFRKDFVPSEKRIRESFQLFIDKGWGKLVDNKYVYLAKSYRDEKDIKEFVEKSLKNHYESKINEKNVLDYETRMKKTIEGFSFGEEQKEAILKSSRNRISVITGGPGTGKTTILDAIIETALETYSEEEIALCSPTGKAARRMTEATGKKAQTIHSLLKVDPTDDRLEKFVFNENNKLPFKMIVIDEASMIDQPIAASLLRAIDNNAKIIFVGDIEQLPPVGPGYFLRDLIESIGDEGKSNFQGESKVSRLLKTYRQAEKSTIIKLSQKVRDNNLTLSDLDQKDDFAFVPYVDQKQIVRLFLRAASKAGIDQAVILTPQNKGTLGVKELNIKILEVLIPKDKVTKEVKRNGWIFREGAKVMQTRNNNKVGLVNGQIGYIRRIDLEDKVILVDFDGELHSLDSEMVNDLALGYALTVHKSQGSEWRYVIEIVSQSHYNNTKSLIYTAITRAKQGLVMIGEHDVLLQAPRKKEKQPRSKILNGYR